MNPIRSHRNAASSLSYHCLGKLVCSLYLTLRGKCKLIGSNIQMFNCGITMTCISPLSSLFMGGAQTRWATDIIFEIQFTHPNLSLTQPNTIGSLAWLESSTHRHLMVPKSCPPYCWQFFYLFNAQGSSLKICCIYVVDKSLTINVFTHSA